MQKKYSKKRTLSKRLREWVVLFIAEEVRHGTTRQDAKSISEEVIHTLRVDLQHRTS